MNFQDLAKVEAAQTYLDIALRRGREGNRSIKVPGKHPSMLEIVREKELKRITIIQRNLNKPLTNIIEKFPMIDDLPPFYLELLKITIDYRAMKQALGAMLWASKRIKSFSNEYLFKMKKARELSLVQRLPKEFIGRVSSIMRQISGPLQFLDEARKVMKRYPAIKTGQATIAIYGFPNVGKTTLLYKLTKSRPEINEYAFTTKELNVGNIKTATQKFQVVDTPGTLNRKDKRNLIEQQAELVLQHVADLIIYVFDLTEPYPLSDQKKLRDRLRRDFPKIPVIVYLSKRDLLDDKTVEDFHIRCLTDMRKLEKEIIAKLPSAQ